MFLLFLLLFSHKTRINKIYFICLTVFTVCYLHLFGFIDKNNKRVLVQTSKNCLISTQYIDVRVCMCACDNVKKQKKKNINALDGPLLHLLSVGPALLMLEKLLSYDFNGSTKF